ncbi:MAG: hypothetical protein ACYSWO_28190 [Planctomycetota bacterium]|jgi:hypothetical protein
MRYAEIEGFNGRYHATDDGRVYDAMRDRYPAVTVSPRGVRMVKLTQPGGGQIHRSLHRVLLRAWQGGPPNLQHRWAHLLDSAQPATPDNLYWGTKVGATD